MAGPPQLVNFGGRFVEPACSYSVYRRKHQKKDDRALYVALSCRYRLAFRAGPLPLPDPSRYPNPLAATEPLSLVALPRGEFVDVQLFVLPLWNLYLYPWALDP